ncbi:Uncharacterized protein TCM_043755 [Theobroma cacao]|uniref:GAG-pre-integrase domain-containing protein n=1 Tax=Theobroma cacao TaxID=3641 RepID=A0A061FP32_THECC|nr:Uncharacterized protein TCM_043755 [Theobroma cacao]
MMHACRQQKFNSNFTTLWHKRFGHCNYNSLMQLSNLGLLGLSELCSLSSYVDHGPKKLGRDTLSVRTLSSMTMRVGIGSKVKLQFLMNLLKELNMIARNKTQSLVNRPRNRQVIRVKWIFKRELNPNCSLNSASSKRHDQLQTAQTIDIVNMITSDELETSKGANQVGTL